MTDGRLFARALALADEQTQAEFFNAFAEELRAACKRGHGWDSQCCYISRNLHEAAQEVIGEIHGFCMLQQQEAPKLRAEYNDLLNRVYELRRERDASQAETS